MQISDTSLCIGSIGRRIAYDIGFIVLICQPKFTIDVAPCFVLQDNRFLVGILHNNGLRHSAALSHIEQILYDREKVTVRTCREGGGAVS
jgi:hypothetical protein